MNDENEAKSSRLYDTDTVSRLVRHFSHEAGRSYDPSIQIGGQRESLRGLGFGALFAALAEIFQAQDVLVVGSGRGFSVACLALALENVPDAQVWFVDPGYTQWPVEQAGNDRAQGLWASPEATKAYFQSHLNLSNIRPLSVTSDDAFARFQRHGRRFDIILIDGNHGYEQVLGDLRKALLCLKPQGVLLAHDARCRAWPGVALAVESICAENRSLESFVLSPYPGLALIQQRHPLLELRHATVKENEQINAWRAASGVTERPLPNDKDPRPGIRYDDPREGLFSVLDGDELIGGFGLRRRRFDGAGPDNFIPDDGELRSGWLSYGAVLAPDRRGRNLWDLVRFNVLRWTGSEGHYSITKRNLKARSKPYQIDLVGRAPPYLAFHIRPLSDIEDRGSLPVADMNSVIEELRADNKRLHAAVMAMESSRSWRITKSLRHISNWLHQRKTGL